MSSILPKNERKQFELSCEVEFFCSFLGELKIPKSHFEINWTLGKSTVDSFQPFQIRLLKKVEGQSRIYYAYVYQKPGGQSRAHLLTNCFRRHYSWPPWPFLCVQIVNCIGLCCFKKILGSGTSESKGQIIAHLSCQLPTSLHPWRTLFLCANS